MGVGLKVLGKEGTYFGKKDPNQKGEPTCGDIRDKYFEQPP